MKTYGFGVDIGGTSCKIGLFDITGILIEKWELPTNLSDNGKYILDDISLSLQHKMNERGILTEQVQGVGIGIPGSVNQDGFVYDCSNLGWKNYDAPREFEKRLGGVKVKAVNDANAAVLGEMWQGGGKGYQNVVMLTLGTGVGGGIIHDGEIVSGANGLGGEIGHITMVPEETECCSCGRKGCLEQYCSATGLVWMTRKMLQTCPEPSGLRVFETITAKDIFEAYGTGDEIAIKVIERFATILGKALSNLSYIIDPEIYVIGGGVSKVGNVLVELIGKVFQEETSGECVKTQIVLAQLGNDAGMYGCVKLILD